MSLFPGPLRLGSLARLPGGGSCVPCGLSVRTHLVQRLCQPVRRRIAARRNPGDGLRGAGNGDPGCRISGRVCLACPPPAADQGGHTRRGDPHRRTRRPLLRSDAGRGCGPLAIPHRWNISPCRVGKVGTGGAVSADAQSAQSVRDDAAADRTACHFGVRHLRRHACRAGQGDSSWRCARTIRASAGGCSAVRPRRTISEMARLAVLPEVDGKFLPPVGIFAAWRLQVYGYAVAAVYAAFLVAVYRAGTWLIDGAGVPVYTDFACAWAAALQALQGGAAALYDPAEFVKVQAALV